MAIPFKSPKPLHIFSTGVEKAAITRHFTRREIPRSSPDTLLLASWNIANFGAQPRPPAALQLISHILQRFDLVAVQEVNDNYKALSEVVGAMGKKYDYIMSDTAGNQERLAFVFRKDKVTPRNLFGELSLRPSEYPKRNVTINWSKNRVPQKEVLKNFRFSPFDRNPFLGTFSAGNIRFLLANVHLYFGAYQNSKTEEQRRKYARRVLEIYTLSRWASGRINKRTTFDKDIVLLGDMNVPSMHATESTYKALVKYGWQPVDYASKTGGSNLGNDKTYDQMVFAPGSIGKRVTQSGVFDFDNAIFKRLWRDLDSQLSSKKAISRFNQYVKFHISDHRPLWVELDIS
jgi:endonuclease/exonuclease/phosphatase family metal-dependent hydrolase